MKPFLQSILFYSLLFLLLGCAHRSQESQPLPVTGQPVEVNSSLDLRWYSACFYMDFKETGAINWVNDLMLADLVVAPVIAANRAQLPLWRFHRRAGRDSAGHRFSFIYYTNLTTHLGIGESLTRSVAMNSLLNNQRVKRIDVSCRPESESDRDIAATSDPKWNPHLQRSWPYYIMGVSAHWLALIKEIKASLPKGESDIELYRNIESELTELWQGQGQHAYFHHLSAIFGYQPLIIRNWIQF